jgi:DUF4097 and DUF4098 domain-containing protein YvlB
MHKNIVILLLTSIVIFGLSGCVIGDRIGQQGSDIHTSAGNIDVNDNNDAGVLTAYNGNISIGHHAIVKSVEVENGNITIDDFSRATSLETTNGSIVTGENVLISGNVQTMNGQIKIETGTEIGKNIVTTTGDIFLAQGTVVDGDIVFEKPGYLLSHFETHVPTLKIGKEVIIKGKIHLYRPIELKLDQSIDSQKIVRHYNDHK